MTTGNTIDVVIRQLEISEKLIAGLNDECCTVGATDSAASALRTLRAASSSLRTLRTAQVLTGLESPTCVQVATQPYCDSEALERELRSLVLSARVVTGAGTAIAERLRTIADAVASSSYDDSNAPGWEMLDALIRVAEQAEAIALLNGGAGILSRLGNLLDGFGVRRFEVETVPPSVHADDAPADADDEAPPRALLRWRFQVQSVAQILRAERMLTLAVQAAPDGQIGVIALESGRPGGDLSEGSIERVLSEHAHDSLGLFDGYPEAYEAAEEYAAAWEDGAERSERCACEPIPGIEPLAVRYNGQETILHFPGWFRLCDVLPEAFDKLGVPPNLRETIEIVSVDDGHFRVDRMRAVRTFAGEVLWFALPAGNGG